MTLQEQYLPAEDLEQNYSPANFRNEEVVEDVQGILEDTSRPS